VLLDGFESTKENGRKAPDESKLAHIRKTAVTMFESNDFENHKKMEIYNLFKPIF
jgi:hypothetical protein